MPLGTELTALGMGARHPDRVYLSGDGSILDLEFQSAANDRDIFRFLLYVAMPAEEHSKPGERVPVRIMVVYTGGIGKRPQPSCPDETHRGEGSLQFSLDQVFLEDRLDMAEIVREYRDAITDRKPDSGAFSPTPLDLVRLWLAPLGLVPEKPWETSGDYPALGHDLSELTGNREIPGMMLNAVLVRGNIYTMESFSEFYETFSWSSHPWTLIML